MRILILRNKKKINDKLKQDEIEVNLILAGHIGCFPFGDTNQHKLSVCTHWMLKKIEWDIYVTVSFYVFIQMNNYIEF